MKNTIVIVNKVGESDISFAAGIRIVAVVDVIFIDSWL